MHLHAYIFQSDTFYIDQFAKKNAYTDTIAIKPYQHHPDISTLMPDNTWHFGWSYRAMTNWKWAILFFIGLLIFGATFWYRTQQEKLILNYRPNDKPPYLWTLNIPNVKGLSFNESFYKTIADLRARGNTDVQQIDMARTVNATVKNAGHIILQYRAQTRPNEYLLLIDMHTPQNHRAQLFNLLYHTFDESEVLMERFYYDGDLRLFWNEKFRRGISLNALQSAYPEHRLIILGAATSLLSPMNGKFLRWANVFDAWRTRALLTPRPVNDWDAREAQLATKFRLLPSSLQGIGDLVENLETVEPKDYRLWKKFRDRHADPLQIPDDLPNDALLVLLESGFVNYNNGKRDDKMLQWIAACAVSPILHWDWTLHIAHIIDKGTKSLLSLENLFQINRLPWFISGKMPESVRITLLDWLEKNYPDTLIAVRKEWQTILQSTNNTPPADSVAFEEHRIQVLFNEWQMNKELPQQKFDELENLLRHNDEALVVEYLKRAPTALDTLVPQQFRKYVRDINSFIPKTKVWLNDIGWQLPILLLLGVALWLFQPTGIYCTGTTAYYNDQTLCIKTPQDSLTLCEYFLCDSNPQQHNVYKEIPADKVPDSIRMVGVAMYPVPVLEESFRLIRTYHLDSASFYKNVAINYYNQVAYFYNLGKQDSACLIFRDQLNKWAWRDSVVTPQELRKLNSICTIVAPPTVQQNPLKSAQKVAPKPKIPPVIYPPIVPKSQTKQETIPIQKTNAPIQKPGSKPKVAIPLPTLQNNPPPTFQQQQPANQDTIFKDPFEGQMIFVQGGTFQMGCDDKRDGECQANEKPVHAVTLSDFSIGKYEVTQKQWKAVMGEKNNPSYFKGDDLPVETVSWDDVQEFLKKLKAQSKTKYRLPTEAEWEFAARGGKNSKGFKYSGSNNIDDVAWNDNNSKNTTHPVGKLQANELGIFDMSGNVDEWCTDWYDDNYYKTSSKSNPFGAVSGNLRSLRGGSRTTSTGFCRVASRFWYIPDGRSDSPGFRVCAGVSQEKK